MAGIRCNRLTLLLLLAAIPTGCGVPTTPAETTSPVIRVGYFPNITHSQALVGLPRGDFQEALGPNVRIDATTFNAGPSVIEALFAGRIDLAYIGPNPAINGYVQSQGEALRIVAGATSGGASFVVTNASGVLSPADLHGKKLATPQLGNTQDVALRSYLVAHGLQTLEQGGGVEIVPTANPQILDLFRLGQIDGAWVPEPWASRLIVEGGGRLFLDERDLWPEGDFVTAHVIVRTSYLAEHPDVVKSWLAAHVAITEWETANPDETQRLLNAEIERLTGKKLPEEVIRMAWSRLRPTWDPISGSLIESAQSAFDAGYLTEPPDLSGIYDLALLNEVLQALGAPPIP